MRTAAMAAPKGSLNTSSSRTLPPMMSSQTGLVSLPAAV